MFGIVKAVINRAYDQIPSPGTAGRKILYLWPFLYAENQRRDQATLVTLSLNGRLSRVNDPFVWWIKKQYHPKAITQGACCITL